MSIDVRNLEDWNCDCTEPMVKHSDHLTTIAELTRERDELRESSRWIPVSERLPEEEGIYPVYCKDTDTVFAVLFVEGEWCFWDVDGLQTFGNVTHWQPLPKAPL